VYRDPIRSAEVKESFKDSKREKLRRRNAFTHRPIVVRRSRKVRENPLEDSSSRSLGGIASLKCGHKPRMHAS
jgi:hypothetical protein